MPGQPIEGVNNNERDFNTDDNYWTLFHFLPYDTRTWIIEEKERIVNSFVDNFALLRGFSFVDRIQVLNKIYQQGDRCFKAKGW